MKKKITMRTICLFLLFCILIPFSTIETSASSYADAQPDISGAKCVYFANLDEKRVLVNKGAEESIAPASTAKLITGLIAIEHFKEAPLTLVTVTNDMIYGVEGTKMNLSPGDVLSVTDLLYATVCGGFNDAAHVLASAVAGTSEDFVILMNKRVKELGTLETTYKNPTGLDTDGMTTTLRDTVMIAKEALKSEAYMEISSAQTYKINFQNSEKEFTVKNRNALISNYYAQGYTNKYARGMIAGMTDNGGYCVVTQATIDSHSYLCIVMGATETEGKINSFMITNSLIYYARRNLAYVKVMKGGTTICKIPIEHAILETNKNPSEVSVKLGQDVELFLPYRANTSTEITHKYYLYKESLNAPISAGTQVGNIDFYYNGELVGTAPLIIDSDIKANEFELFIVSAKSFLLNRASVLSIVFFIIIFSIYISISNQRKRRFVFKS